MIRPATAADAPAIRRVHEAAFGRPDEAELVEALEAETEISVVALTGGELVGHVLLSRAGLSRSDEQVLALAPLGVVPGHQRSGHGRALVRAALEQARTTAFPLVVVLGHPAYYAKLGFEPARRLGIRPPFLVSPEAWRAVRLPAWEEGVRGTVRYPPAFGVGGR